jgi:ferredoxin
MRIRVDPDRCQGHNRCVRVAPELFDIDEAGYASASGDGTVPAEMELEAELAADTCPEQAIEIIREPESRA